MYGFWLIFWLVALLLLLFFWLLWAGVLILIFTLLSAHAGYLHFVNTLNRWSSLSVDLRARADGFSPVMKGAYHTITLMKWCDGIPLQI